MNSSKPLAEFKLSELNGLLKITEEEIRGDLQEEAKLILKKLLEGAIEDELMEEIGIS